PAPPLPGPSPYSGPTRGLTERPEPESRPVSPASRSASPVRTVRAGRVSRPRLPPVLGTHSMTLRPSTASQRVPLPSPPASSLLDGPDQESDSLRAASPTVTRFLATAVTDPLFESSAASALVAELVDFAAACPLDYATSLFAASASVCPPSVGGECALGTDVLEDRQEDLECFAAASPHLVSMLLAPEGDPDALDIPTPRSYAEAIEGPYSSQWKAAIDAEMASWKSTGTYVDEVPPPGANIVAVDSGAATGAEPAGAGSGGAGSGGAETEGAESGGAETWGAEPGGAATGGTEPGGTDPGGTEPGGAEPGVTEPGGAEPGGAGSAHVASRGASSRREVLSPQELREWFARRWGRAAGAGGTTATTGSGDPCPGGAGAAGRGGAAEAAGVGPTGGSAGAFGDTGAASSAGPGAAGASGVGAAGGVGTGGSADAGTSEGAGAGTAGAGGATGAGAPAVSPGAVPAGSGGTPRPRPYFVLLLEQVLGLPPSPGPAPSFECPQPVQSQSLLQPVSPLPAPSPYTGPTGGLAERRAPASRPASLARPACTSRRTSRPRPPAVPGTHQMALRPSTAPLRIPLPSPPASSLPAFPDPESDSLRAASPTIACFLATVVTDPSLASTAAFALVTELVDFAASCRLDYAASLVAESASVCPPSIGGECALSTDVLEERQDEFQCFAAALPHLVSTLLAPEGDPDAPDIPTPRTYAEAIEGPYSSQWQAAMDAEMASWKSTGTYVDEVPPVGPEGVPVRRTCALPRFVVVL
ncbi:unnamed protein product, partial [Closterium sp. NIES-54]